MEEVERNMSRDEWQQLAALCRKALGEFEMLGVAPDHDVPEACRTVGAMSTAIAGNLATQEEWMGEDPPHWQ